VSTVDAAEADTATTAASSACWLCEDGEAALAADVLKEFSFI